MAAALPGAFHPSQRLLQQLRGGAEIPVGVGDMHMSEIGGELRQVSLDIHTAAIPSEQRVGGEPVAQIQQARSA
jgi:hypothetical protein